MSCNNHSFSLSLFLPSPLPRLLPLWNGLLMRPVCKIEQRFGFCWHQKTVWRRRFRWERSPQDASRPCPIKYFFGGPYRNCICQSARLLLLVSYIYIFQCGEGKKSRQHLATCVRLSTTRGTPSRCIHKVPSSITPKNYP